jgi:hypothetical protein
VDLGFLVSRHCSRGHRRGRRSRGRRGDDRGGLRCGGGLRLRSGSRSGRLRSRLNDHRRRFRCRRGCRRRLVNLRHFLLQRGADLDFLISRHRSRGHRRGRRSKRWRGDDRSALRLWSGSRRLRSWLGHHRGGFGCWRGSWRCLVHLRHSLSQRFPQGSILVVGLRRGGGSGRRRSRGDGSSHHGGRCRSGRRGWLGSGHRRGGGRSRLDDDRRGCRRGSRGRLFHLRHLLPQGFPKLGVLFIHGGLNRLGRGRGRRVHFCHLFPEDELVRGRRRSVTAATVSRKSHTGASAGQN